jgi:toluene monooxygenase electron transfer component
MNVGAYSIRIANADVGYDCEPGDTVLRAGLRAGVGLPYECNAGGCGSCKFELLEGEVLDLWPQAPGIRPKDRERGRRLACQSTPVSDCLIKVRPESRFEPAVIPRRFVARLMERRRVTREISEFRFAAHDRADFLPGQYALLRLNGEEAIRAYSMSNLANDAGEWAFMIRRVPEGAVTPQLFDMLSLGDEVEFDGPYGLAYLQTGVTRDLVCVAGGSGLAPIVSIARGALLDKRLANKDIWLFYGARGPLDIPRFGDWIPEGGALKIHPAISVQALADEGDWAGEVCFVHELLPRKLDKALPDYEFYLAGPPPMIEAVVRLLVADHQVPPAQIHYDRFF